MKKQLFFIPILIISLVIELKAQENMPIGTRQASLGGVGLFGNDVWMSVHNQAGLAKAEGPSFGSYFNNRFQLQELRTLGFALVYPSKNMGTFGLNYTQFGYEMFKQSKFSFAYGKKLFERVDVGIAIDYFRVEQGREYGAKGFPTAEIGVLIEPIDNFFVGAHAFNPWGFKIKDNVNGHLNSVFSLGVAYNFSDKVLVAAEVEKDLELPVSVKFGTEYEFIKNFFLRVGMSTKPAEYSFGLGYSFKGITLDIGVKTHSTMGLQYHFGLNYTFLKKYYQTK